MIWDEKGKGIGSVDADEKSLENRGWTGKILSEAPGLDPNVLGCAPRAEKLFSDSRRRRRRRALSAAHAIGTEEAPEEIPLSSSIRGRRRTSPTFTPGGRRRRGLSTAVAAAAGNYFERGKV